MNDVRGRVFHVSTHYGPPRRTGEESRKASKGTTFKREHPSERAKGKSAIRRQKAARINERYYLFKCALQKRYGASLLFITKGYRDYYMEKWHREDRA